jgi:hypothetical protein
MFVTVRELLEFALPSRARDRRDKAKREADGSASMLQQLNRLTLPTAISIASFDATFFIAAEIVGLTGREVLLGVLAGAVGGLSVLAAVLWQSTRNVAIQATN